VANLGPGLDILGVAVTGLGDAVRAEEAPAGGVVIRAAGHPDLPTESERHTSGIAAAAVLARAGSSLGVVLDVEKGLPLDGGLGGSAASAVAAAVAVDHLLGQPLDQAALLECCLEAEERVAGRHADNLAPSLVGGLVLLLGLDPVEVVSLPAPDGLLLVLARPEQRMRTRAARAVLPSSIDRGLAMAQAARVGALVAALATDDRALLRRAVDDLIAEPARAPLLPGFPEAKKAALASGALGCSISGSGPTVFAFAVGEESARQVAAAMQGAYAEAGIACRAHVAGIDRRGAHVSAEGP
jgi:homoserine kinase